MAGTVKGVCFFHNPASSGLFYDYEISTLDPTPYFLNRGASGRSRHGGERRARSKLLALQAAAGVDSLYRDRDPDYMRFVGDFVDRYRDASVVIMATYNPVHPEILHRHLPGPTKILGFIDDPYSTYIRGIPFLWAFDGAFYISPVYGQEHRFADALKQWGCNATHWSPLVVHRWPQFEATDRFFRNRDVDAVYVGASYGSKINRLARIKRRLGPRFRVHGRWAFGGNVGWLRGLLGKPVYPHRVTPLSDAARMDLYTRTKIGLNMHLSNSACETGNMRMYEVPAHGAMLLCDKGALDAHELIFAPDVEAVYYDDVEDAIEKIEYFAAHSEERIAIARAGFARVQRDYTYDVVIKGLLDWASSIRRV